MFVWLKCDGSRCLCRYLATRVGWPNGGVPALLEPDFDVLPGHYYVIWYCICVILLNSKHLSQFCVGRISDCFCLFCIINDNYLTTICVSAQPIHQMIFGFYMFIILVEKIITKNFSTYCINFYFFMYIICKTTSPVA